MKETYLTKELIGEALGTFIIVFIGTGTVALEVLFNSFEHIVPIAILWGIGVALAIFTTRNISPAHLNPAVSFAMVFHRELSIKKLFFYWGAQFTGAFIAGGFVYLVFGSAIHSLEVDKTISTAKMFGEYYSVSTLTAFILEMLGTLFLVFMILIIVSKIKHKNLIPILIGLVVTVAIIVIAPYTQCGINPARDLAPRLFSHNNGWENVAFSQSSISVYVVAPLIGGAFGGFLFRLLFQRN